MRTTYYDDDDILVIHLSDKPIAREVSQDWNTHVSYAADGTAVEVVVLDARANGAVPVEVSHGRAAYAKLSRNWLFSTIRSVAGRIRSYRLILSRF